MSAQGRVSGGRPAGGRYTSTARRDPLPLARRQAIDALRRPQLVWKEQQDLLDPQRHEVDKQIRQAATACAAIEMLDGLPQSATLTYRRDGEDIVFAVALEATGDTIVDENDLHHWDGPWDKDSTFQAAVRRSRWACPTQMSFSLVGSTSTSPTPSARLG